MAGFSWSNQRSHKFMDLKGAPKPTEAQKKFQDMGKGRQQPYFTQDYYITAGKATGLTPEQARAVSDAGGRSGSGKVRDQYMRRLQDLNDGGNRVSQYSINKKLAKQASYGFAKVASLKASPPNPNDTILKATSSNPDIAKANAEQSAYVASLRSGGVGIAEALLKPKTTQTFFKNGTEVSRSETSINLEKFLEERGYDVSKPETIPDSIFQPEKQTEARAQAKSATKNNSVMGDLNLKANKYEKTSKAELDKRKKISDSFNFEMIPIKDPKFSASQGLEYFGPTDKRKIENFKLMEGRPLSLMDASTATFGTDMITGKTVRLKTVAQTTSPEMQFFGQFIQGSRNTFDSYGNMFTNAGNFLQGKPQQPLARPPVQDQFFGAVIDSAKNTFEGPSENRASDPLGEFFGTQQKRIDRVGYGQVAGELFTEGLIWATPIGAVGKLPKIAKGFFSPTVKTTKQSKAFTPGGDFMKLEGKTKDISWGDQLGAFFGPKGPKGNKVISQPFKSSNVPLGTSLGKGPKGKGKGTKKTDSDNFFGGSSGTGKKFKPDDNSFFKEIKVSGSRQVQLQRQKQIPKTKKGGGKMKSYPIQLGKSKQQFFKPIPKTKVKQKQKLKQKQQFFKPIPLITPRVKQKQLTKQKQSQVFKPIPKLTPMLTPKLTPKQKQKYKQTGVIAPYFPPTAKTTGMFLPPLPFFIQGGRRGRKGRGKRRGKQAFTAWNVNTKQVGSFLRGPTYKKSRSDYIFKDLDARTKKAKKEKDYDYLDFF